METLNFKSGLTMETEWLIHFDALAVRISQHRARCIENAFHDPQVKRLFRKRPDFPSGIFIGLGLTIWSCIRQRELHIAFADFVRLQRSGRS